MKKNIQQLVLALLLLLLVVVLLWWLVKPSTTEKINPPVAPAAPLIYQTGQLPTTKIERIISAGPPADIFLLALAPEKLSGLADYDMTAKRAKLFPPKLRKLPVLGRLTGKNASLSAESVINLAADFILDIGNFTPVYQDLARKMQQKTKTSYVLLNGDLANSAATLRLAGKLMAKEAQAEKLAQFAEQALAVAQNFKPAKPIKVYLAGGVNGLTTGMRGSIHTEVIELLGLTNVADSYAKVLADVSIEQILAWQPDVILVQQTEFYRQIFTHPVWKNMPAVQQQRVYLVPNYPVSWLDTPPSLNRLLGIYWLAYLLQDFPRVDMAKPALIDKVTEFFNLFYHIELTAQQSKELLAPLDYD